MTLPPVASNRLGRRLAGGVVLALLLAIRTAPAPAAADDAQFSATVHVDASADNAEKAREMARTDGQRQALAAVVARLSGTQDAPQVAKLDDQTITDMVDSFEVADEHMSAVRYLADYTFHFKPAKVRALLGSAGTAAAAGGAGAAGPSVVLPVFADGGKPVLWSDPNPWRAAWRQMAAASASARFELPLGDLGDLQAVDARRAVAGDAAALAAVAQRNGAAQAVVALATARRRDGRLAGLEISTKLYRDGHLADARTRSLDANPGETGNAFLARAAGVLAADLDSSVKPAAAAADEPPVTLAAVVPIAGLDDWIRLRDRLHSIATIKKLDLLSLTPSEATVAIHYVGGADALKSSLAASDFALSGGDPVWRIEPTDATTQP